jgi:hypothetical protein
MGKDGTPTNNTYLVGAASGQADAFEWGAGPAAGEQIEISGSGITIRDTVPAAGVYAAAIDLKASVDIVKTHTLTLEQGVTVTVADDEGLVLNSDANSGAKLLGAGKLLLGDGGTFTEITGGQSGWQATGAGTITIGATSTATTITASASAVTLKALGSGAVITELAVNGNNLSIVADTVIDLGGTPTQPVGQIILTGGAQPAKITLAAASSKIQTGNQGTTTGALATDGDSVVPILGIANLIGIGTAAGAQVATTASVDGTKIPAGYLVSFVGGSAASTILTNATGATISSETQTAEDNT